MTARPRFPKHLQMTPTEWRTLKRQEWREVEKTLATFAFGASYTPAARDIFEIQRRVEAVSEDMDGEWIAW